MKIGVLGVGKMGGALLEGMRRSEDLGGATFAGFSRGGFVAEGVEAAGSARELAAGCEVLLLCVKPKDVAGLLDELGEATDGKLLVSVAAGVGLATLARHAPGARVVRAMPNTPSLAGEGASAFAAGEGATGADRETVRLVLGSVGLVREVPEPLIDAVTGVSGSGPAFVYQFVQALADGGEAEGLPAGTALELAVQTVRGAAEMLRRTGRSPEELTAQVASPGGTTLAGLAALEERGFPEAVRGAVGAAAARSREMGKE